VKHATLARRYARALSELAGSTADAEKLADQLGLFTEAMAQSPELQKLIANPSFSSEREKAVLAVAEHLGLSELARRAIRYLIAHDRLPVVSEIVPALRRLLEVKTGKVRAELRTVGPLSADRVQRIRAALERITGRLVVVEQKTDPELIGGVVATIGSVVYDGSLRSQLASFRSSQGKES
jgi:F-type H+-transporting ATPase subunit delta